MLLVLTGAGDELQGMKKGIMELADAIIVNKADGEIKIGQKDNEQNISKFYISYNRSTPGWTSTSLAVSSCKRTGLDNVWEMIVNFKNK